MAIAEKILRHSRLPLACSIAVMSSHRIAHLFELPSMLPNSGVSVAWVNGYLLKAAAKSEFGTQKISPLSLFFMVNLTRGVWAASPFAESLLFKTAPSLAEYKTSRFLSSPDSTIDTLHRSFLLDTPDVFVDEGQIVYAVDPSLNLVFKTAGIAIGTTVQVPIKFARDLNADPVDVQRVAIHKDDDTLSADVEWACITAVYAELAPNGFVFDSYSELSSDVPHTVKWSRIGTRWMYYFAGSIGSSVVARGSRGKYTFKRNQ